jgi:hypothetical protein
MKPSFLGLMIAAIAFGASTVYLSVQLKEERAQADRFIEESRVLSARIVELEKSRADLEELSLAGGAPVTSMAMTQSGGASPPAEPATASQLPATPEAPLETGPRAGQPMSPARSEAMQKMRRAQLRANNKRLHSDIGDKLGLSREESSKLIDLLTDQQMAAMRGGRQERSADGTRSTRQQINPQDNLAEVTALIGADKAELYRQYQETMPARQEVSMLERQLEGADSSLSKDQRDRMITALADERKRVPEPKYSESGSREDYSRAVLAWQEDYQERAATRARSILDSEQLTTFTEYQQWNREMRAQFEARRSARGNAGGPPGSERPPR